MLSAVYAVIVRLSVCVCVCHIVSQVYLLTPTDRMTLYNAKSTITQKN